MCGCRTLGKPAEPLRTVGQVTSLREDEIAAGRHVALRGVITLLDPGWRLLAIQDESGGMLVEWPPLPANLRVGDLVEMTGATSVDNHIPSVVAASLRVVGTGSLPRPQPASPDSIACGNILYRLVEVEIVPDEGSLGDDVHTAYFGVQRPCSRLVVIGRMFPQYSPAGLVGRRLRVRGVPLAFYSPSGKIDHVRLMFDNESDVDVLESRPEETSRAAASVSGALPEIRSVRAVKALPRAEASRGYPVRVEGVVIALNPRYDGYFLQDGSAGVFVFLPRTQASLPRVGQRVRLSGLTDKGGFAPVIRHRSLEALGTAPLPAPVRIEPGDVFHGWEENLWVEFEGIATAVVTDARTHQLELFAGPRRVLVWFSEGDSPDRLQSLVNARVLVQGVYSPLFTASGAWLGFRIFTTSPGMLKVLDPPAAAGDFRSIASLSQFDVRGAPRRRFRTAGAVTYRDTRGRLYLQDGDNSLHVVGNGPGDPPLHTWATVEGFLSPDTATPQLEHVRWLSATPGSPVAPARALAELLASGDLDGRLVAVEGFVESRRTSAGELQLSLLAGRSRFTASMEAPGSGVEFPDLRPGALLRLTGVPVAEQWRSFAGARLATLWLRNANDIVVLRHAPWWDLQRALYAAFAVSLLLIFVLAWVVRLRHNLAVQMTLRSKLEERLLHAQKLESVGRLAGGVAHDFNNYLTVVLFYTSQLLDSFPDAGAVRRQLTAIHDVAQRAASLTGQLLAFSRKQLLQPVPCDLNEIITQAKATLLPLIGEDIELVIRQNKVDRVNIDPAQFLQVLVNLAVNARDAMPKGGKLIFETATQELGPEDARLGDGLRPGQYVGISITDTGVGMDHATRQRIFEPFFTTKERGRGTGLGLAVVFGIVKQSNGHIEVQSKPGEGSCFRIYLPATEAAAPEPEPQAHKSERAGAEVILVVEDQAAVRTLLRGGLQARGYTVLDAASPAEALKLLDDPAASIDLLLTDIVMPEMSGRALAAEAILKRPGIRVLYMSGYSEEVFTDQKAGSDTISYLQKPFSPSQVAAAVRSILDRSELGTPPTRRPADE
jgi:signal transduction histidine kinase/CheY-like chemotaxis protein